MIIKILTIILLSLIHSLNVKAAHQHGNYNICDNPYTKNITTIDSILIQVKQGFENKELIIERLFKINPSNTSVNPIYGYRFFNMPYIPCKLTSCFPFNCPSLKRKPVSVDGVQNSYATFTEPSVDSDRLWLDSELEKGRFRITFD